MTVCFTFFYGISPVSRIVQRHYELIKLSRAKLTEILTRLKTMEQAPVFQLMFQRVAAATIASNAATRSPA